MSKLDAQRAMRAAKYDAAHAGSSTRPSKAAASAATPVTPRATRSAGRSRAKAAVVVPEPEDAAAELCGHRSMSGKACKRPAAHPETNHRYT